MTKQNFWLLEEQDIVHYIIKTHKAAEIHVQRFHYQGWAIQNTESEGFESLTI